VSFDIEDILDPPNGGRVNRHYNHTSNAFHRWRWSSGGLVSHNRAWRTFNGI